MSRDKYKDIQLANLDVDIHRDVMDYTTQHLEKLDEELVREMELSEKEEKEYKEQIIKHLAGIEKNTAVLQEISFLLRNSNDKQEEILKLITEMFEVLKSNTKEEVTSKFRNILDKINQFSDDVQTWQSLYTLGSTIYNTALQLNF